MTKEQQGFTLLELSIVLVIIGLIAGGITVGADMIRAAELRAVITEHQRYKTAVFTFRDKYFALPGDMTNATAFWGEAHATPATCVTTASTGTETCNGDGNGKIDRSTSSNEQFRFWQHLANAKLINGNYSGRSENTSWASLAVIDTNIPSSKHGNSGWSVKHLSGADLNPPGFDIYFNTPKGHSFVFGTVYPAYYSYNPTLESTEAWNIDKKIDDGHPSKGSVRAGKVTSCTDAANRNDLDSVYNLVNTTIACSLIFANQF